MYNLNNADVFVGVNTCHSVMWKYTFANSKMLK